MQIHSVGIDLGKTTFHLVALGVAGKVLVRKKFTQKQLLTFTANMQTSLIGLEACPGAHFLDRALRDQGHDVRLIAAQFVKPFVKSNKNDFVDAEAIAEAVERKNMRLVPIKTDDQLDLQALHRVRERLMMRRTALINQNRGFPFTPFLVALSPDKMTAVLTEGPYAEAGFLATIGGGKTWSFYDPPSTGVKDLLRVDGKYWTTGHDVVGEGKPGGGYGVPIATYSEDGMHWTHTTNDIHPCPWEYCVICNSQGCLASGTDLAI
jgi:Transposase